MNNTIRYLVIFAVTFVVLSVLNVSCVPYDDTDNIDAKERSGLILYTDHLTGCQYLKGGLTGGLTPRVDYEDRHVGCRP